MPQPKKWSLEVFQNIIQDDYISKNLFTWKDVCRSFDFEQFEITNSRQFEFLVNALRTL